MRNQQTKEQLLLELTKVKQSHEEWVSGDEKRRREFARAFGWRQPKKPFDYGNDEIYAPTWTEIFVEIGKMLGAKTFYNFEGNVGELEYKTVDLEAKLKMIEEEICKKQPNNS